MKHLSKAGFKLLKKLEGCRLQAYKDSGGVLTIGYGHTNAAGSPYIFDDMCITQEQAEDILRRDVVKYENVVNSCVDVRLTQWQFDALVIFCYNVGISNFSSSKLVEVLNDRNFHAVPSQLRRWVHVNGKVNQGLVNRRNAEINMWLGNLANVRNKVQHCATMLAPFGAFGSAIINMISDATILQITLACLIIPGVCIATYYYWHHRRGE